MTRGRSGRNFAFLILVLAASVTTAAAGEITLNEAGATPGGSRWSQNFENVSNTLPRRWRILPPLGDRRAVQIEPLEENANHVLRISGSDQLDRRDSRAALTCILPEPANRIAVQCDLKWTATDPRHPSLWLSWSAAKPDAAGPVRMRILQGTLQQDTGLRGGWIDIPTPQSPDGAPAAWYRLRLVAGRHADGVDVWISRPNGTELPDKPTATVPAYGIGQAIASVRFGVAGLGDNRYWIDNVVIRTGADVSPPHDAPPPVAEQTIVYPLWTGKAFPRTFEEIDHPPGIEFHIIADQRQPWTWFHGAAIAAHKGKLYASWGANQGAENSDGEVVLFATSIDGGKTWTKPELLASGEQGFSNSHGPLLSDRGRLWSFNQRWKGGWDNPLSTELFVLNEQTRRWESHGVVAHRGWPLDRPERTARGDWIIGVSGFKMRRPGVMISQGDDLSQWRTIAIPTDRRQIFPETSVLVDGDFALSISRWDGGRAMVATSHDGGRTWSHLQPSNFPMTTSKPDAGVLSTGQWYALVNIRDRNALMLAVGDAGEQGFSQLYKVRFGSPPERFTYPGGARPRAYAYPYAMEHEGKLYVVYSVAKEDIELAVIPIASLVVR